eukprot:jgi/Tetstr1/440921/TSEL_029191.t1
MAEVQALAEQVVRAVSVLYGSSPAAQAEANSWLTAFAGVSEAWEVCLALLVPGQAAEVQFYSANTMLKKIREQWGSLSGAARAHLCDTLSERLQAMIVQSTPALVTARTAIVVSLSAVFSGEEAAGALVQHALGMAASGSNLNIAVELLTAIADETEQLDRSKRQPMVRMLVGRVQDVFAMVDAVLAGRLDKRHAGAACKCLSAWLKLDVTGAGGRLLSLGEMYSQQAALLSSLLAAIGDDGDEGLIEAASDVLLELMSSGHAAAHPDTERAAIRMVMGALLHHEAKAREGDENVAHALCAVASAVADRDVVAVAGQAAEAVPLAQLMMACLAHPERRVVEGALDYFLMLNTVPVAERHVDLQLPLFGSMLEPLLRHATMPVDLQDWEGYTGDDKDSFARFREQILTDALETCYGLLRTQYLAYVAGLMAAADTWQRAEVCLFAIRCVALSVKSRVLSERKADLVNPAVQAEKAETTSFLLSAFGRLTADVDGGSVFWSNVLVVEAAARMVGAYAAWFGACREAPMSGALRLLLRALSIPKAGGHIKHAATSLRNLCARCSAALLDPSSLSGLMDATEGIIKAGSATSVLELQDRQAVVEGLARIVSMLPPGDARPAAVKLVTPLVQSAQVLLNQEAGAPGAGTPEQQAEALAAELHLIASAVRFMEFAGDGLEGQPHPALQVVEGMWPILSAVAESARWNSSPDAIEALCSVYQRCIISLKGSAAALLQPMVSTLVALLDVRAHPPCLAALGTCAEVFGALPEAQEALASALSAGMERVMRRLQVMDAKSLAEGAEFVAAALTMADRFLVFAPGPLLGSSHLPALLGATVRVLSMAERDPVGAALNFSAHLSAPSERQAASPAWQAAAGHVAAAINAHGEALVAALLRALCGSCPRHLLRVLAGCLYGLVTHPTYHAAVAGVMPAVLLSPEFPAVREGLLKEEDCKRFCSIALRQPALPRQRFDALVSDMAALCRAEGTADALLAYEM